MSSPCTNCTEEAFCNECLFNQYIVLGVPIAPEAAAHIVAEGLSFGAPAEGYIMTYPAPTAPVTSYPPTNPTQYEPQQSAFVNSGSSAPLAVNGTPKEVLIIQMLDDVYPPGTDNERRTQLANFLFSPEYLNQEPESPKILEQFVEKLQTKDYRCTKNGCNVKLQRLDRIRDHFRTHINHRPFPCLGCPTNCGLRFFTKEALKAHQQKDEKKAFCVHCGTEVAAKNLKRHQETAKKCPHSQSESPKGSGAV